MSVFSFLRLYVKVLLSVKRIGGDHAQEARRFHSSIRLTPARRSDS